MLPEEVTKLIGQAGEVRVFEVEKGAIKRFTDAVDDPNPLYWNEEYARNSRYGSIIAPPGFISTPWLSGRVTKWEKENAPPSDLRAQLRPALEKAGYTNPAGVDAGIEYEFFLPVRAGDTIAASAMIKEITEREGRTGKMVFVITETTYTNQNAEIVAKSRGIGIQR